MRGPTTRTPLPVCCLTNRLSFKIKSLAGYRRYPRESQGLSKTFNTSKSSQKNNDRNNCKSVNNSVRIITTLNDHGGKMEFENVSVKVGKEAHELAKALVKLVAEFKKANADGFQAIPDITAIVMASYADILKGVQGIEKLGAEFKADKDAFIMAFMVAAAELIDVLTPAPVPPAPPAPPVDAPPAA